ncbi:MAG TPA: M24 family metallopeptidase, partial [Solirubrobacteraceae bacterium]|nr:M24 family metallopeptidase [Solirubrobacteraceae bacterium]
EVLDVERLRSAAEDAARAHGAVLDGSVIAVGEQSADGHESGSGPVRAGVGIVCDLWPQDRASGCFGDFTRTFVAGGEPSEELVVWHGLCRDALARVLDAVAPGVTGRELWEVACDVFEAAGHATQRTKAAGESLDHGFYHSLGHGVGLQVHEAPALGRSGVDALVEGDVIAIEPGTYRPGFGGVRLEETVLVTVDGYELLTTFDHELRI